VPTIYQRACVLMVGTLRFAHPANIIGGSTAVPLLDQPRLLQRRFWSVCNSHDRYTFRTLSRQQSDHRCIARNGCEGFFPSTHNLMLLNLIARLRHRPLRVSTAPIVSRATKLPDDCSGAKLQFYIFFPLNERISPHSHDLPRRCTTFAL
jgi:hypothetical protein